MSCIWVCRGCSQLINECGEQECPFCGELKAPSQGYDDDDYGDYLFHKQQDEEAEGKTWET